MAASADHRLGGVFLKDNYTAPVLSPRVATPPPATRHHYMDYLRILSMFCVIMMHAAARTLRAGITPAWHVYNVVVSFSFIAVPVFFMLSGALQISSARSASVGFLLRRRLPKLLVPLIAWSLVFLATTYVTPDGWSASWDPAGFLRQALLIPHDAVTTHLWFMYYLIPMVLLVPFLKAMTEHLQRAALNYLVALWGICAVLKTVVSFLPDSAKPYFQPGLLLKVDFLQGLLGYFLIGYLLHRSQRRVPNGLLVALIVADLAAISVGTYYLTSRSGTFDQRFQSQYGVFTALLAFSVFLLFKQNLRRAVLPRVTAWLSSASFGVYLMHNIFISLLSRLGLTLSTAWLFVLTSLVSLAGITLLSSVKPLCYLFTGLSYSEASKSCNLRFWAAALRDAVKKR